MKKIKLYIKGMHCKSCEMLLEDAFEDLGVVSSKIDFANLKRTKKVLFISNEIHRRFIDLGVSLGVSTGVNKFNKEFLEDFSKVSQVKDKHYGGFGITKNNIITFYTNY